MISRYEGAVDVRVVGIQYHTYTHDIIGSTYHPSTLVIFSQVDLIDELRGMLGILMDMASNALTRDDMSAFIDANRSVQEVALVLSKVLETNHPTFFIHFED